MFRAPTGFSQRAEVSSLAHELVELDADEVEEPLEDPPSSPSAALRGTRLAMVADSTVKSSATPLTDVNEALSSGRN